SRNRADFRRLVYSFSRRFKLATDTFKGPDETQEPGFRPKHCRNDDLTPGNVKLWESPGRAGGLPCYLGCANPTFARLFLLDGIRKDPAAQPEQGLDWEKRTW